MSVEAPLRNILRLSQYEARTYLALLRGGLTAKDVARASRVPLPRIYDTLRSLELKGFVEESDGHYTAIPPKIAVEGRLAQFDQEFRLEQQQREQTKRDLVAKLDAVYAGRGEFRPHLQLLKGINAIANRYVEILGESRDVFLLVRKAVEAKHLFLPLLQNWARAARGRRIRILLPAGTPLEEEDRALAARLGLEIRRSEHVFLDLMVADQRDVMLGVPDPVSDELLHAIGIWIRNPSFARSLRENLEELWVKATPLT